MISAVRFTVSWLQPVTRTHSVILLTLTYTNLITHLLTYGYWHLVYSRGTGHDMHIFRIQSWRLLPNQTGRTYDTSPADRLNMQQKSTFHNLKHKK